MTVSVRLGGAESTRVVMLVTFNHAIVFAHDKQHSAPFFASLFDLPEPVAWGSMRLLAGDATRCCLDHAVDGGLEHWADPQPITNHGGRGVYFRDPTGHNLEALTSPPR